MASNQDRELLEKTIEEVRGWTYELSPYGVEYMFLKLDELNQSKNEDLWSQLRKALADNHDLNRKAPTIFFDRPHVRKTGTGGGTPMNGWRKT